jgi:hypothetical protein
MAFALTHPTLLPCVAVSVLERSELTVPRSAFAPQARFHIPFFTKAMALSFSSFSLMLF